MLNILCRSIHIAAHPALRSKLLVSPIRNLAQGANGPLCH